MRKSAPAPAASAPPTRERRCARTSRSVPPHVALAVLGALARSGELGPSMVAKAVSDLESDAEAVDPLIA